MSYRLLYERRFIRDLMVVPPSERDGIRSRLEWLAENATTIGHTPLREPRFKGVFRLRIGRWRIFYQIDHKQERIIILCIIDRKEAYR